MILLRKMPFTNDSFYMIVDIVPIHTWRYIFTVKDGIWME